MKSSENEKDVNKKERKKEIKVHNFRKLLGSEYIILMTKDVHELNRTTREYNKSHLLLIIFTSKLPNERRGRIKRRRTERFTDTIREGEMI